MPKVIVKLEGVPSKLGNICNDNRVGLFLAQTWANYFDKYIPKKTMTLSSNYTTTPFKVTYNSPYAHYQWEGEKYIDPVYKVGGFHNADFSRWWSRPGVTKVPSGEPLNYSKEQNPLATSHWEEPAFNAFQDDVARQLTYYLRRL